MVVFPNDFVALPTTAAREVRMMEWADLGEDCSRGLRADSGEDCRRKGGCAGPGGKVDAPELSSGPGWEIQEVSRVGAQGVTSKSKLLAREMPRVCSRGLRVDSEAAKSLKVAPAQSGSKSMRRSSPRDLEGRYRR